MSNTFFASDHHLGHANILVFKQADGVTPCRPFTDVDEMNEAIIERHNSVVREKDTIWFLGDVVINRRYLELVKRFNGRKRLILGNHDIFKNKDYYNAGFEDLHSFRKFDRFVATHVPVHPDCISQRWHRNVHGHTHNNLMMLKVREQGFDSEYPDQRYINVCVEQINYTPISLEEINARIIQ